MKWRKISEAAIVRTLEAPERTEMSKANRMNAYKRVDDRLIKVTYVRENSDTVVVTVLEKKEERERQ